MMRFIFPSSFQKEILYFLLHDIYVRAIVISYFADSYFTFKINDHLKIIQFSQEFNYPSRVYL